MVRYDSYDGLSIPGLMYRPHSEADLSDVVTSREFLDSVQWIDADRIGVMGASYGGYLTFASITFHPDVFDMAISIVGFPDFIGPRGGFKTLHFQCRTLVLRKV